MACGDRYLALLRTADGRTPADPCAGFEPLCVTGSYDAWYVTVSQRITLEIKRRLEILGHGKVSIPPDLQRRLTDYFERVDDLPSSSLWAPFTLDRQLIDVAVDVGREGLCLLELLDEQIRAAGLSVPETAGAPPIKPREVGPIESAVSTVAAGALVIGAVWITWKLVAK